MTLRDLVLRLLKYRGITSLDPAENSTSLLKRGLGETDIQDALNCVNAAAQEAFTDAGASVKEQTRGDVLRAPASIILSATINSSTINVTSGWASWMEGCTVRLPGDQMDNRLISQTQLLRPYLGGTGSIGGQVFADCIPITSTVRRILDPVWLPNQVRITVANSLEEFLRWNGTDTAPAHEHPFAPGRNYGLTNKSVGEPCICYADTHLDYASAFRPLYLRFNPMPGQAYAVSFRAEMKAPLFTLADVDNGDHETDPGAIFPMDYVESTLMPYALQRWQLEPDVVLEGTQAREALRQYQKAKLMLEGDTVHVSRTRAVYGI